MKILSGIPIANAIYKQVKQDVSRLQAVQITPRLAVILVGEDKASLLYVEKKQQKAKELGIEVELKHLPKDAKIHDVLNAVEEYNRDDKISGIIVQLPLPEGIPTQKVVWQIDHRKDVDGFQMRDFRPPAPQAIIELLLHYHIPTRSKNVTLVGNGTLVGKPLSVLLRKQGARLTICDKTTKDLPLQVKMADIVISAVGKPGLVTEKMVEKNQIIVDAGTSSESAVTRGDVDKKAYEKVRAVTPVPGGIGPITLALLFKNVVVAAKKNVATVEEKDEDSREISKDNWQWPLFKKSK